MSQSDSSILSNPAGGRIFVYHSSYCPYLQNEKKKRKTAVNVFQQP